MCIEEICLYEMLASRSLRNGLPEALNTLLTPEYYGGISQGNKLFSPTMAKGVIPSFTAYHTSQKSKACRTTRTKTLYSCTFVGLVCTLVSISHLVTAICRT